MRAINDITLVVEGGLRTKLNSEKLGGVWMRKANSNVSYGKSC